MSSSIVTPMRRSSFWVTVMEMEPPLTKPFLRAVVMASDWAALKSGIIVAPANAAASAARCSCVPRAYQPPTSTASPANARSGMSSSAVMIIV